MLISPEYAALNAQLHASNPSYGVSGHLYAREVAALAESIRAANILDYGAGKRTLEKALAHWLEFHQTSLSNYDPGVPGLENISGTTNGKFDLVVCTDVLEHIEPECLDDVFDHIYSLTRTALYVAVHCGPAIKTLPDGRNTHLIQRSPEWWLNEIVRWFHVVKWHTNERGFTAVLRPRSSSRMSASPQDQAGQTELAA